VNQEIPVFEVSQDAQIASDTRPKKFCPGALVLDLAHRVSDAEIQDNCEPQEWEKTPIPGAIEETGKQNNDKDTPPGPSDRKVTNQESEKESAKGQGVKEHGFKT